MALINRSSKTFKVISFGIILGISAILYKIFIENWNKIPFAELSFNVFILILSLVLYVVLSAFGAWLWTYLLYLFNEKPPFIIVWRINVYAQMTRYIPGKVWQYLSKMYWGSKIGLPKKTILLTSFLETLFLLCGAFIVSLFSLKLFMKEDYISYKFLGIVSLLLLIVLIIIHPRLLEKVINTVASKIIKQKISLHFSYFHIVFLVFLYVVLWIVFGFQIYLFISSFYSLSIMQFFYITSLHSVSWLIGFLSSITPSGLGIKEGVFIYGLKTIVPVSFAILCAILVRLYSVAMDVLIALVFLIFDQGAWKNFLSKTKKNGPIIKKKKAIFLDRDGVVNQDTTYPHKPEHILFKEYIFDFCKIAQSKGYLLLIVTNQAGVAKGMYSERDVRELHTWMNKKFNEQGIVISHFYYCPFHRDGTVLRYKKDSDFRKPNPGMILQAVKEWNIDITKSIMIGDKPSDRINLKGLRSIIIKSTYTKNSNYDVLNLQSVTKML